MEKLVLIDGNSLINRAFYAMPILTNKEGVPTNAVYGFMNMFFKMVNDIKPTYVGVAFDLKAPTFRHKLYAEYKGTRKPMPEELRPQIPLLKELLSTMGVTTLEKEGSEADDIIGTIAKATDVYTIIITGDKDSFQLVDEQTEVLFTKRGITETEQYTAQNFTQKTTLVPDQIIDLKALMGDASDNIPGIAGVGEKTALSLLAEYKTVENLYAHTDNLKGKLKEKVIQNKDTCFLSKTLATIDTACGIDFSLNKMRFDMPLSFAVKQAFLNLGFKSLANKTELFEYDALTQPTPDATDNLITPTQSISLFSGEKLSPEQIPLKKVDSLEQVIINEQQKTALVMRSNGVYLLNGQTEFFIPIQHTLLDEGFAPSIVYAFVARAFGNSQNIVVYDKKELRHLINSSLGVDFNPQADDLSIIKYIADYNSGAEKLDDVIAFYGQDTLRPALSVYNIYIELYQKLINEQMETLYKKVELPLADVLFEMEISGFKADATALAQMGEKYRDLLNGLENEIRELASAPTLNINSPKQLGEILFEKLKIGKGKKTKTGYSTTAEVLENLEDTHPIVPKILRYRKVAKILSTYIDGFKPLIDKNTGLIHTSFNQTVTSTGRLSSKEPNLQNIPVRDDEGRFLRKFFVPKSDERLLIGADYSQIELRLLAAFSNCPALIKAFNNGEDIHVATASKVFKTPLDKVTKAQRSAAKAVNFGIIYGISEYGLAKNLKISPAEAREYIANYFLEYPEVREYMSNNVEFAKTNGYAKTMFGRRRYIKELESPSYQLRQFGERAAMNMPLQGSSADIIKLAMLGVQKKLKAENLKSELILQIHDELIIDAFVSEQDKVERILKEEMENAASLSVPLSVDVGSGKTWFDTK